MHMNGTSRTYTSQRKIQWPSYTAVTPIARLVAAMLDTAPSMYVECWRSAKWVAAQLGLSVSAVQKAMRELELKGLISRVVDYALATRRRIILLWRVPAVIDAETITAEPEEEHMNHAAVVTPVPTRVAPDERHEGVPHQAATTGRKATPAEVADLVRQAAALGNPSKRWVLDLCRKHGLANVARAVDYATRKGKRRFGWVVAAVASWGEEGVPEHLMDDDDRRAQSVADVHRIFGPGGELEWKPPVQKFAPAIIPVPVVDDRNPFEAWANSGNATLRRLAAAAMKGGA